MHLCDESQTKNNSRALRALPQVLLGRGVTTVGDLAALTVNDINSLPLRVPKFLNTRRCLEQFARRNNLPVGSPSTVTSAAELLVMSGNLAEGINQLMENVESVPTSDLSKIVVRLNECSALVTSYIAKRMN